MEVQTNSQHPEGFFKGRFCGRCGGVFSDFTNNLNCISHPGKLEKFVYVNEHGLVTHSKIGWDCCSLEKSSPGCTNDYHAEFST